MIEHLHIKRLTPDSRFRNCDIRHIDFKPGINLLLGANTSGKTSIIESLEDYFSYIKNIGFVSAKDMIKMTLNIEFLRHFALKEIKKLIDEISTEFGKIDDSKSSLSNISKLFANLMSITNIDAGKIDEQRENLSNIRKLIFGETIFGKRLGFLSNLRYSSISQIIEMINNFGKDLGDTTNNVNNIKKIMLLLNKNIISLKLDEKGAKANIKILTLVHKKELPASLSKYLVAPYRS